MTELFLWAWNELPTFFFNGGPKNDVHLTMKKYVCVVNEVEVVVPQYVYFTRVGVDEVEGPQYV